MERRREGRDKSHKDTAVSIKSAMDIAGAGEYIHLSLKKPTSDSP